MSDYYEDGIKLPTTEDEINDFSGLVHICERLNLMACLACLMLGIIAGSMVLMAICLFYLVMFLG